MIEMSFDLLGKINISFSQKPVHISATFGVLFRNPARYCPHQTPCQTCRQLFWFRRRVKSLGPTQQHNRTEPLESTACVTCKSKNEFLNWSITCSVSHLIYYDQSFNFIYSLRYVTLPSPSHHARYSRPHVSR